MKEKKRENCDEIKAYIKARHKLGLNGKDIYGEICDIFGSNKVSYRTVLRWIARFRSGQESLKDNAKSGRPKTSSTKVNVENIKEILMKDGRYTMRQIACLVGISLARAHHIVKYVLKMKKICARWIPHILTNEQKQTRVRVAKRLLKMFPKFDKKKMANIVTGDETWVYFFEPHRKAANKIWAVKHLKRPCIARRVQSAKKVLYAIFFDIKGHVIQIVVPKGRGITGKFYKNCVLKKLKSYYIKRRPKTGFKNIRLLHDNAPAHKSKIVTEFLRSERVTVLPHPPYSPDLAPCDFFLFPRVKKHLAGKRYTSRESVGSAVYQCMKGIPTEDYENAFKRWIHRLKLCVSNNGDYFEGMK